MFFPSFRFHYFISIRVERIRVVSPVSLQRRDDRDRIQPRAHVGILLNNENRKANSIGSK